MPIRSETVPKLECFLRALAESFRFLDWMLSFFIEVGREVWKNRPQIISGEK